MPDIPPPNVEPDLAPWATGWPTEPGWYWFYGQRHGGTKKLIVVQARMSLVSVYFVAASGEFLFQYDGWTGVWQRIVEPQLPTDLEDPL